MLDIRRVDDIQTIICRANHARSFGQRLRGLIGRKSLPDGQGMLFEPGGSIHTIGMRFPIDVLFLDKQRIILASHKCIVPFRICFAPIRTLYVLEIPGNSLNKFNLQDGQQLSWTSEHEKK